MIPTLNMSPVDRNSGTLSPTAAKAAKHTHQDPQSFPSNELEMISLTDTHPLHRRPFSSALGSALSWSQRAARVQGLTELNVMRCNDVQLLQRRLIEVSEKTLQLEQYYLEQLRHRTQCYQQRLSAMACSLPAASTTSATTVPSSAGEGVSPASSNSTLTNAVSTSKKLSTSPTITTSAPGVRGGEMYPRGAVGRIDNTLDLPTPTDAPTKIFGYTSPATHTPGKKGDSGKTKAGGARGGHGKGSTPPGRTSSKKKKR